MVNGATDKMGSFVSEWKQKFQETLMDLYKGELKDYDAGWNSLIK